MATVAVLRLDDDRRVARREEHLAAGGEALELELGAERGRVHAER